MAAADTPRGRLALFGGLYFAQGVPWGLMTVAMAARLSGEGAGPAVIAGVVATAQLPWTFKLLLAPLVDRVSFGRFGRRRPIILGAEVLMAASLLGLLAIGPVATSALFLALVFLHNGCAAAQDVATDALALDLLPAPERGRANGVMSAARYGGVMVGGPGTIWIAGAAGWNTALLAAAALVLLPAGLVLATREPARPAPTTGWLLGEALRSFASRVTLLAALFALVVGASSSFLFPLVMPLLRKPFGLTDAQLGLVTFTAGAFTAAGSLVGGALADRLGRRRAVACAVIVYALAHAGFAASAPLWPGLSPLFAYQVVASTAAGAAYAATLALFMDLTNPRLTATHFQAYMALLGARSWWATLAGGRVAEAAPAPMVFLAASALELLPLLLLPLLDPRRAAAAFKPPAA